MNDTGRHADRMGPKISSPASMFEKVLRAFTEGDLHYADVQLDLKRLLSSGAPPQKLLEYFPRLAEIAHKTLFGTDWPGPGVPDVKQNLDEFRGLPIKEALREQILSKTAASLWPE